MNVGDVITYRLRRCRVLGMDPSGVEPQKVYLEDVETGDRLSVDMFDIRRHLRVVRPS